MPCCPSPLSSLSLFLFQPTFLFSFLPQMSSIGAFRAKPCRHSLLPAMPTYTYTHILFFCFLLFYMPRMSVVFSSVCLSFQFLVLLSDIKTEQRFFFFFSSDFSSVSVPTHVFHLVCLFCEMLYRPRCKGVTWENFSFFLSCFHGRWW